MEESNFEQNLIDLTISTIKKKKQISIQNLTGYISQLPDSIRNKYNFNKSDFKNLLLKHSEIFSISDDDIVQLKHILPQSSSCNTLNYNDLEVKGKNADDKILNNVKGQIIALYKAYGFIKILETTNATVYFDINTFENGNETNLNNVLKIEDIVIVTAKKTEGHKAQYRAFKVWRKKYLHSSLTHYKSSSSIASLSSQDSDKSEINNGIGIIDRLFLTYGFIKSLDRKKKIFFHRNKVVNCNERKLIDIFKNDDIVHFNAIPSKEKTTKEFIYEATKVWTTNIEKDYFNETENDYSSESSISINEHSDDNNDVNHIYNETGKIYFSKVTDYIAKIVWGNSEEAIVLSEVPFYDNGERNDLAWVLDDGNKVNFDAEFQSDSNLWRTLLIWIGNKPQEYVKKKKSKFIEFKASSRNSSESKTSEDSYARKVKGSDFLSDYKKSAIEDNINSSKLIKNTGWFEDSFDINNEEWPDWNYENESKNSNEKFNTNHKMMELNYNSKESFSFHNDTKKLENFSDIGKVIVSEMIFDENSQATLKDTSESGNTKIAINNVESTSEKVGILESEKTEQISNGTLNNEISVKTFKNIVGIVKYLTKEYAFISSDILTDDKPFFWEDAYYDGLCISENFSGLNEIFEEFEHLNFNYLSVMHENGKIWERITLVWKGIKPKCVTELTTEQFLELLNISNQKIFKPYSEEKNKNQYLNPTSQLTKVNINETTNQCKQTNISESKIEERKLAKNLKDSNNTCVEDNETLNYKVNNVIQPEIIDIFKELLKSSTPSSNQIIKTNETLTNCEKVKIQDIGNSQEKITFHKNLQTDIKTCDEGTQTFITGKVLSFEIFPC